MSSIDRLAAQDAARTYTQNTDVARSGAAQKTSQAQSNQARQATSVDSITLSDEQYAAVVARDHAWLEQVTRQQERLSSRLEQAESKRLEALGGMSLQSAIAQLPDDQIARTKSLSNSIGHAVTQLKMRQNHTA